MHAKQPIIYETTIDVRFGDLDPYGHVNSRNYLDFVISSRWAYVERNLNLSSADIIKRGIGFFMTKSTLEYLKPIVGAAQVRVRSHVSEVRETRLDVPCEIASTDGKTIHSRGLLEFAIMDLKARQPTTLPDWAEALFFSTPA